MQAREQLAKLAVPAPVQVVGESMQARQRLGYGWVDPELTNATHDLRQ